MTGQPAGGADPHASIRDRVLRSVLEGPGQSDAAIRKAAADGKGVPAELQSLVEKIHQHAYRVTDEDIAALRAHYSDDQLFEIVVSAALGASRKRLFAGLQALDEA
jgi:alkylhydroperoxidase family enzyme